MPRKPSRAALLLVEVGRAIYGPEWVNPLARDLRIDAVTLRHWKSGHSNLPMNHGVMADVLILLREKTKKINRVTNLLQGEIKDAECY